MLKVNASEQNTKSKCYQITSPGSVFFSGCYRLKAGNADKGPGLTGHSLSSKKCRLCICTFHKAGGIFDVWRKWILERPVDILKKVLILSLRSILDLYYQHLSHTSGKTFSVSRTVATVLITGWQRACVVQVGSAHFKSPSHSFLHQKRVLSISIPALWSKVWEKKKNSTCFPIPQVFYCPCYSKSVKSTSSSFQVHFQSKYTAGRGLVSMMWQTHMHEMLWYSYDINVLQHMELVHTLV